jgi:hypothetical protein
MLQVVYLPKSNITIERFLVISDLDELLDYIKFNRIELLSIPANEDVFDIVDTIINNDSNVKTIHIQQNNDLLLRLKMFFMIAKAYSEHGIKKNIILKHEYLDNILEKNNKKD